MPIEFSIPGSVPSSSNLREHWAQKAKRVKAQRISANVLARMYVSFYFITAIKSGATVTLTRVYAGRGKPLDNHDNLASSMKPHVDGIANALGLDDGDARLTWLYEQLRGPAPCVRVRIEART